MSKSLFNTHSIRVLETDGKLVEYSETNMNIDKNIPYSKVKNSVIFTWH